MNKKSGTRANHGEKVVKDIRRATRKQYSAEEKIRIVLDGLKGEGSIAELCRREGIAQSLYYSWSKEFLEAGKKRLAGEHFYVTSSILPIRQRPKIAWAACKALNPKARHWPSCQRAPKAKPAPRDWRNWCRSHF